MDKKTVATHSLTHLKGRWFQGDGLTRNLFARCRCDSPWRQLRTTSCRGQHQQPSGSSRHRQSHPSDAAAAAAAAADKADDTDTDEAGSTARTRPTVTQRSKIYRRRSTARQSKSDRTAVEETTVGPWLTC